MTDQTRPDDQLEAAHAVEVADAVQAAFPDLAGEDLAEAVDAVRAEQQREAAEAEVFPILGFFSPSESYEGRQARGFPSASPSYAPPQGRALT